MEILEVAQPQELGGNLHNVIVLLLLEGRYLDGEEMESLLLTHVAQERSKCSQGGQIPCATHLHLLDTIQLHHAQDLHNIVHWHGNDLQLLTTQVYGRFSLLHPPKEVGEEVVQGPFFQGKVYKNLQWSHMLLCH